MNLSCQEDVDNISISGYYSLMKIVNISHTKNNLSALIDLVKQGETVLIVDRNKPVARLESALTDKNIDVEDRVARLERNGSLRQPISLPSKSVLKSHPPKAVNKASILQALLAERENAR